MAGSIQRLPDRKARPRRARYRGPDGWEHSRTFARKVDAARWLRGQLGHVDTGGWVDPSGASTPFGDVAARFMAGRAGLRPSTVAISDSYMRSLVLPTFATVPVGRVTASDLEAWLGGLVTAGKAPATIRKAYQLAAGVLRLAARDGLITRAPLDGVRVPKVEHAEPRWLTAEQVEHLARTITAPYGSLIRLCAYTGLRIGEAAALHREDVDVLRCRVTVRRTLVEVRGRVVENPPKTRAGVRNVAIPRFLVDELAGMLANVEPGGRVFTAPGGGVLRPSLFRARQWAAAVATAGLVGVTPHDLRHTHVALLIAQGEHPRTIAERHGSTSVRFVLDRYGHLFEGADEAAAARLDQVGRAAVEAAAAQGGHTGVATVIPIRPGAQETLTT